MARKTQNEPPQSKVLGVEELRDAILKLNRRINDLQTFDLEQINERFDAKVEALETKLNDTLADIFGRNSPEFYQHSGSLDTLPLIMGGPDHPIPIIRQSYAKGIQDTLIKLNSLKETLEEKLEDLSKLTAKSTSPISRPAPRNRKVFIVHGHDDLLKESVARYLSKLDLEPIILHEQPNQGRTIIEKLEANVDVDFAVVLLTPDDIGYSKNEEDQKKNRARQNVVLELGLFIGILGRSRVCALYKGDIELPSDFQGVLYIHADEGGAWKLVLAKEIKQAGIQIDLNMAI